MENFFYKPFQYRFTETRLRKPSSSSGFKNLKKVIKNGDTSIFLSISLFKIIRQMAGYNDNPLYMFAK